MDSQSAQSAHGGEQTGFDKFNHCRGRKRRLVVDTIGFPCARTVTSATVSDRVTGRGVPAQAKARHRNLAKGWIDGGYANPVDSSLIGRAARELRIDLEVVKRSDDVKSFAVIPWRWVVERTNGHRTPALRQRLRTTHPDRRGHDRPRNDRRHAWVPQQLAHVDPRMPALIWANANPPSDTACH